MLAQTGLSFDLSTASGKLMRTIMASLAEFERDLIRDRVKSGLQAAKARGGVLGRKEGQRPSEVRSRMGRFAVTQSPHRRGAGLTEES